MSKSKKEQPKDSEENKAINNPHDKFFKAIFAMRTVVKEYLDNFFPKDLLAKLDIETLEIESNSYITSELEEFFSDIVWRCKFRDKEEYAQICFIFEHKSYVPKYPNVQIGDYKQGAYNKQIKMKQPLQLVMPIVVYHGEKE